MKEEHNQSCAKVIAANSELPFSVKCDCGYKIIKDKNNIPKGISINAKRVKNPKTLDEAFGNLFSNFI